MDTIKLLPMHQDIIELYTVRWIINVSMVTKNSVHQVAEHVQV